MRKASCPRESSLYEKSMGKILILVLTALSSAGCVAEPVAAYGTDNSAIDVHQLFTHDGCTVYRFRDASFHYYVTCARGPAQTMTQVSCGKNCVREEAIVTTP